MEDAKTIKTHFKTSHESFMSVHQLILRQDLAASLKSNKGSVSRPDSSACGKRGLESDKRGS
ncbi:hypothetical protein PC116_g25832 [Phytophthora cactorum]|uniref:Uncharacterized protein n=1 Tax=Phytophthora cactorum TaxID=29920 RepID=A0A8T1F4S8_9STRA|nr:hypothetical protein PC112_g21390 [Phytophthora cactorum]KAG2798392.1 hypothetical protein PC111_g20877 [Phytophthora cactorum]KAG2829277.1 hypothetical protein PC113_g21314 [Phytophthora cactorum]KAG2877374.1 hypothetical protein PC114_g23672 [Phytophthora cactorum]KAG2893181.1 hypothetical protein PC117_g23848 [Phytophthora cactorum]